VRIIGGSHRSRLIEFPERVDLRPTPDRVRETLFNWLGQDLTGLDCLDLFAGSGALGFEAASRGAAAVVMVERDTGALHALRGNAARLDLGAVQIVPGDALEFLQMDRRTFDVVFADPPFSKTDYALLLARVRSHLAADGRLYVEAPQPLAPAPGWSVERRLKAGHVYAHLLQAQDHEEGGLSRNV
jgi:16S rRNA (guanine(966)-N(2))-methyltransferase RsmD